MPVDERDEATPRLISTDAPSINQTQLLIYLL